MSSFWIDWIDKTSLNQWKERESNSEKSSSFHWGLVCFFCKYVSKYTKEWRWWVTKHELVWTTRVFGKSGCSTTKSRNTWHNEASAAPTWHFLRCSQKMDGMMWLFVMQLLAGYLKLWNLRPHRLPRGHD